MKRSQEKKISHQLKKSLALMSTSILAASLITPLQAADAAEQAPAQQKDMAKTTTPQLFLDSIVSPASSIAAKNDLYASVMLAQAILESGWGQSSLAAAPNYNLFGIKGDYNGESVRKDTLEDNGKQEYYGIQADFRKYPSYQESLEDYAALLREGTSWDPTYYSGAWKSNAPTYQEATEYLTGRYATDTAYAKKLNRIIEEHELDHYDTPATEQTTMTTYTVKSGDTLYSIAGKHQITLEQLMAWNGLKSSLIQPGMALQVTQAKPIDPAPPITPAQPQTPAQVTSDYRVQPGDTLWSISRKTNVTVSQLTAWNQLKGDLIQPGQLLKTTSAQTNEVPKDTTTETAPIAVKKTVQVKNGDTLYRIAREAGISVSALKSMNQLKNDLIHPGQVLYISETVTPAKPAEEKQTVAPVDTYTVQKGDNLFRIAKKHGVSVTDIMEWNNVNSTLIHPGQTLRVQ